MTQSAGASPSIAVLGAGSFGTVIANMAAQRGAETRLWMRSEKQLEDIRATGMNSRYVPKYPLHDRLIPGNDLAWAVGEAQLVFVAVPSKAVRAVVSDALPSLRPDAALVSLTKGIEPTNFQLMSEILRELAPDRSIGVLSGPNLAREIADGHLTGTVVATASKGLARQVHDCLASDRFRVYANTDVYGVELAGALKNIYAIAAGMGAAMAMGENTRALLITRSLAEMSRFARDLGADPMTFIGLAGMGDLLVTCSSPLSRNYRIGYALGQGHTLKQAVQQLGETAEGVNTLRMVKQEADRRGIYMPLVQGLYAIVHENADVDQTARQLMLGARADDVEFGLTSEIEQ